MRSPFLAALLLATVFAGCLSDEGETPIPDVEDPGLVRVEDRYLQPYVVTDKWSHTLVNGTYEILPGFGVGFDVTVPLGNGLPTQQGHMGLFLPKIDGCDWTKSELPDSCKIPVVADVGPYYGEALGDAHATKPAGRLGAFLIDNLVPHGYAIAQVSVMGTGDAGGCMDLMGPVEQAGVQAAVDWLGTAPWSNGNVALIGRSYDGSTPWEAAMNGSPHLKTIVPISGLLGQWDLMWKNGTAEDRGPFLLWGLYYAFTYSQSPADTPTPALQAQQIAENAICPDTQTMVAHGLTTYALGSEQTPEAVRYWQERRFSDAVLENYEGSVYYIHGMQDWNVDPHMAFPFYQTLEAKGLEMKGLFGQWGHMYPDRVGEHGTRFAPTGASIRMDWAQDLLEWFDHYLKGTGPKPGLHVEMQDDTGAWRIEETWPPADLAWRALALGDEIPYASGDRQITPVTGLSEANAPSLRYRMAVAEDLRIAGMPRLHVQVTPSGPGGQLGAELWDGERLIGKAVMDLRYHVGGETMQTVTPGRPITAMMEFFPMDSLVKAGSTLELRIAANLDGYLPSTVSTPVTVSDKGSVLKLPTIERGQDDRFTTVVWDPCTHDTISGEWKGANCKKA